MHREIDRQQQRESVQKKALIQIAERAEPAEREREKNNSGDIAEQKIAQPTPSRVLSGKPNSNDQRCQRDPAKPALVERRETQRAEQSARHRSEPRPKTKCVLDHFARLTAPTSSPLFLPSAAGIERIAQIARVGSVHAKHGAFDIFRRSHIHFVAKNVALRNEAVHFIEKLGLLHLANALEQNLSVNWRAREAQCFQECNFAPA